MKNEIHSSVGEYKTVEDVISDLNVMISEAPISTEAASGLAEVRGILDSEWLEGEA
jgi:hypothetical protein|tara:strand:+ start:980 stop:1147 length:168 start_codon:yes stop_codon:yes gene_type:complete